MDPSVCDGSEECFLAGAGPHFLHLIREGWCPVQNENVGSLVQKAGTVSPFFQGLLSTCHCFLFTI